MRIAFYTDSFYPYVSGVATAAVNLAQNLAEAGHDIFIQAPEPKKPTDTSFLHKNIHMNFCPAIDVLIYPDFRLGTGLPLSLQKIRTFDPDIIHIHTPLTFGLEGILTAKALKKPVVQTFHTYFMDPDAMKLFGIYNKRVASVIENGGWRFHRGVSRFIDATIAPSEFVAKDLIKEKTPGEIFLCPNMLEKDAFLEPKKIPTDRLPTLIFVGRLSVEKRIHLLLKTVAELKKKGLLFPLVLIGDGPEREKLFKLSFDLGISSQISWKGKIPHHELIAKGLYQTGDIFFTLSHFETFGYTTAEAMAQGLPVLATRSRANKEIIGRGGVVVPESSSEATTVAAAVKVLGHYDHYDWNSLAKAAHEEVQKYYPKQVTTEYERIYREVLKNSGKSEK